jgi:hypothetical protein
MRGKRHSLEQIILLLRQAENDSLGYQTPSAFARKCPRAIGSEGEKTEL